MKTNSLKTKKRRGTIIEEKLRKIPFKKIAKQSGFCKRKPRKIKPKALIMAFIQTACRSKKSTYTNWANQLGLMINSTVSKQAVCKRMTESLVVFLKSLLKAIMEESLRSKVKNNISDKLKQFKGILIEDSTTIQLDSKFSKEYPGSRNHKGKEYAILKIQSIYDVLKKRFLRFEITNFRKNDQGYSGSIIDIAKAGDLIIRDLGYFVLKVFKRLIEQKIYFISRLRTDVNIYSEEEKPIDLAKMLKKRGNLDIEVFAGEAEKIPVRLIAMPVDDSITEKRRRNAKKNRDRRINPSKEHLFLLGWNIFITNVEKEKLSDNEIALLYLIRWRIEIIYKSWKSHLRITNIPIGSNKSRVEAFIYCILIFVLLFQVYFYECYLGKQKLNPQSISLLKLMLFIIDNINIIIYSFSKGNSIVSNRSLKTQILYHCTYEKRTDRLNYSQLIQKLG
jgi:hypothetical protein